MTVKLVILKAKPWESSWLKMLQELNQLDLRPSGEDDKKGADEDGINYS